MEDSETKTPGRRSIWWLLFLASFALPWLVCIGSSNAMTLWFPGQFKVDHWRNLSSISFLFGGFGAALLLFRLSKPLPLRLLGIFFVVAGSLFIAFILQLRSNCGDESVYLGERKQTQVASCS